MKLLKNKILFFVAILLLATLVFAYILVFSQKTKTSTVIGTYNNSATDGCDGFKLKNGDSVDTFCFWTKPEDQTDYQGQIKVGDKVEYGTKSGKQFIRIKK